MMTRARLVLLISLPFVLGAVLSGPASAREFLAPSLRACKDVPDSVASGGVYKGLYSESHCVTNVASGLYAWATAGHNGTWYCLLSPAANQLYTEGLCQTQEANGTFLTLFKEEPFPKLVGASGLSLLLGKIEGVKVELHCLSNDFVGQPLTGSTGRLAVVTFLHCSSVKPARCEVKSTGQATGTIATDDLDDNLDTTKSILFAPETGKEFVVIEYAGTECGIAGEKLPVDGSQECLFAENIEQAALTHELSCTAAGSKLTLGSESAEFSSLTSILTEPSLLWKIRLGLETLEIPPQLPELPFRSPSLNVCKDVPGSVASGGLYKGLYSDSHCATNVAGGLYAWATAGHNGTWYCLLSAAANQLYTEGLCQTHAANGSFLTLFREESFPRLLGTGGLSLLLGTIEGVKAELHCLSNDFIGQPLTGSLGRLAVVTFLHCTSIKPTNCEVKSTGQTAGTVETVDLDDTLNTTKSILFTPETGKEFVGIEYAGAECKAGGLTLAVDGLQECTFTESVEQAALAHALSCTAAGSKLTLGSESAEFSSLTTLLVENSLLWKIR
jgi:hypothetical protein